MYKTDVDTTQKYIEVAPEPVFSGTVGAQPSDPSQKPYLRPDKLATSGGAHQNYHPLRPDPPTQTRVPVIGTGANQDMEQLALENYFQYGAGNWPIATFSSRLMCAPSQVAGAIPPPVGLENETQPTEVVTASQRADRQSVICHAARSSGASSRPSLRSSCRLASRR